MLPRFRLVHEAPATYVMRHGYMPEGLLPSSAAKKSTLWHVDRWDPSVCITSVAWSPNAGRALLLASGSAHGIVRVEWVEQRS